MTSTEKMGVADQELTIVVVNLTPKVREQLLVLCERFPLKDVILVWLLLKKCTNDELVLNKGIELDTFNYFISLLKKEPYEDVADIINRLIDLYRENNKLTE